MKISWHNKKFRKGQLYRALIRVHYSTHDGEILTVQKNNSVIFLHKDGNEFAYFLDLAASRIFTTNDSAFIYYFRPI